MEEIVIRQNSEMFSVDNKQWSLFHLLLNINEGEDSETLDKGTLIDEAFAICFAGTDTTTMGLSMATYYMIRHPSVLNALREELQTVPLNRNGLMEYNDVVALPYLVLGTSIIISKTD